MRKKLIGALVAFALLAGGTCAKEEPRKYEDKPVCVKIKTPKPGSGNGADAKQQECKR